MSTLHTNKRAGDAIKFSLGGQEVIVYIKWIGGAQVHYVIEAPREIKVESIDHKPGKREELYQKKRERMQKLYKTGRMNPEEFKLGKELANLTDNEVLKLEATTPELEQVIQSELFRRNLI